MVSLASVIWLDDNHFRKATEFLQKIKLYTNVSKAGRPKKVNGQKVPVTLTKEEEQLNETISLVRGKVEAPYEWVKQHFAALSKPFFENQKQHHTITLCFIVLQFIELSFPRQNKSLVSLNICGNLEFIK